MYGADPPTAGRERNRWMDVVAADCSERRIFLGAPEQGENRELRHPHGADTDGPHDRQTTVSEHLADCAL
jgi:hypothetical protein